MPICKICKARVDVSQTGVRAYRCRVCGKMFCKDHFLLEKSVCVRCAGYSEEKILQIKRIKKFNSWIKKL
jgi:predicted nucleic acid binding AN1-type Zn finger protein